MIADKSYRHFLYGIICRNIFRNPSEAWSAFVEIFRPGYSEREAKRLLRDHMDRKI